MSITCCCKPLPSPFSESKVLPRGYEEWSGYFQSSTFENQISISSSSPTIIMVNLITHKNWSPCKKACFHPNSICKHSGTTVLLVQTTLIIFTVSLALLKTVLIFKNEWNSCIFNVEIGRIYCVWWCSNSKFQMNILGNIMKMLNEPGPFTIPLQPFYITTFNPFTTHRIRARVLVGGPYIYPFEICHPERIGTTIELYLQLPTKPSDAEEQALWLMMSSAAERFSRMNRDSEPNPKFLPPALH